jgi:hypothetical protein
MGTGRPAGPLLALGVSLSEDPVEAIAGLSLRDFELDISYIA